MRPYSRADDAPEIGPARCSRGPAGAYLASFGRQEQRHQAAGPRQSSRSVPALPDHLHLRDGGGTDSDWPMSPPRTVVFDLDGTLVDTAPDLINALNYVLDREGLPPVPLQSARNMIGAGARKLIERGLELEGRAASVDDINRLTSDFIDYYAAHIADASRPFDGLEGALDELAGAGISLRGLHQQAGMAVEAAARPARTSVRGLPRSAAPIRLGCPKPDPAILRETVARAGGHLSAAIMVGDAGPDVGVARRAGIPVIGVEFGYTDVPIAELKPDRLIGHMRDLPGAVASLMKVADIS